MRGNCQILRVLRWNEATKFLLPFAYTRFLPRLNQLKTRKGGTRWKRTLKVEFRSTKIRFVFEENNYTGWRANYYSISRYWSIIELLRVVYFVRRYFPEVVDNRCVHFDIYFYQNYNSKFLEHVLIKLSYILHVRHVTQTS